MPTVEYRNNPDNIAIESECDFVLVFNNETVFEISTCKQRLFLPQPKGWMPEEPIFYNSFDNFLGNGSARLEAIVIKDFVKLGKRCVKATIPLPPRINLLNKTLPLHCPTIGKIVIGLISSIIKPA